MDPDFRGQVLTAIRHICIMLLIVNQPLLVYSFGRHLQLFLSYEEAQGVILNVNGWDQRLGTLFLYNMLMVVFPENQEEPADQNQQQPHQLLVFSSRTGFKLWFNYEDARDPVLNAYIRGRKVASIFLGRLLMSGFVWFVQLFQS